MKLLIENGHLYANNLQICLAEVMNDRCENVRPGSYEVRAQYSPAHGVVLPLVDGFSWLANDDASAIILGRVRARTGTIPCQSVLARVIAMIEASEDEDKRVTLEIK